MRDMRYPAKGIRYYAGEGLLAGTFFLNQRLRYRVEDDIF